MFCFRSKRRLYDYIEGYLSREENLKIKGHLEKCPVCRREYQRISVILGLAAQKSAPKMSQEFWKEFQAQLDEKLSTSLQKPESLSQIKFGYQPRLSLKPAFAVAVVLILLIGIAGFLFWRAPFGTGSRIARADREIVNELILYEELEEVPSFLLEEEAFLKEEIELIYQLGPSFVLTSEETSSGLIKRTLRILVMS